MSHLRLLGVIAATLATAIYGCTLWAESTLDRSLLPSNWLAPITLAVGLLWVVVITVQCCDYVISRIRDAVESAVTDAHLAGLRNAVQAIPQDRSRGLRPIN